MEKLKYNVLRVEAERKNYLEELRHRFDVAVSDISTPEGAKLEFARGKMSVQEGRAGQLLYGESALSMSFSADLQTLIRLLLTSEPFTEPTNGAADFFADGTYGGSRIDFFAGMTGTTGTGDNQASQGEANEQSTPGETSNWNPFDTTTIRIRTVAGIELKPALLIRSEDSLESWQAAFDRVHSIGYGPDILLYFDKLNNNLGRTVLQIFEYMERHDFDHSFVVNGDEYILVRVIGYWRVSISPSQTDHLLKDFLAVTWHGIQLWKTGERVARSLALRAARISKAPAKAIHDALWWVHAVQKVRRPPGVARAVLDPRVGEFDLTIS
ncbi:hypothetical protein IAR55_006848 [Kwoniella newhampshirensis]|uniref:Uncharacterized protein n=1 Tax=Kwoniella newhampshirensis TaxID=1651941 RepID=A0AAW0YTN0_9TREE